MLRIRVTVNIESDSSGARILPIGFQRGLNVPCKLQVPEQEMEVDQSSKTVPSTHKSSCGGVIQRPGELQPTFQVVPRTHVIGRKNMRSAKATEHDIFRRPPADPAVTLEAVGERLVRKPLQFDVFELSVVNGLSQ